MLPVGYIGQNGAGGGSGAGGSEMTPLTLSNATLRGASYWTIVGEVITATLPIPGVAVSTLESSLSVLLWSLGPLVGQAGDLTCDDVESVTMSMDFISLPSTLGDQFCLPFGIVSTSAAIGSVDFSASQSRWASIFGGSSGAVPGTTIANSARSDNATVNFGSASRSNVVRAKHAFHLTTTGGSYEADSFSLITDATSNSRGNAAAGVNYTGTNKLYAFVAGGRSVTSGITVAPRFRLTAGVILR